MSMYAQFQTDPELETKGIFVDYGDFRVTIARAGGANAKFAKVFAQKSKPHRKAIQSDTLDPKIDEQIMRESYAEAIILNWEVRTEDGKWKKGIEAPDGKTITFTMDNVLKTLEALPDLLLDLGQKAQDASYFLASLREKDSKN